MPAVFSSRCIVRSCDRQFKSADSSAPDDFAHILNAVAGRPDYTPILIAHIDCYSYPIGELSRILRSEHDVSCSSCKARTRHHQQRQACHQLDPYERALSTQPNVRKMAAEMARQFLHVATHRIRYRARLTGAMRRIAAQAQGRSTGDEASSSPGSQLSYQQ